VVTLSVPGTGERQTDGRPSRCLEYHEAVEFLFDLRRYPPAVGVESTRRLLDRLGRPDEDLRVV
jgi:hypothetical protein